MSDPTPDDARRLLRVINTLLNLFIVDETRFPPAEGRMRYNPIDFQTLRIVETQPGIRATDIAALLRVAPTTLQSALDRLLRKGLLDRRAHPDDARARAYFLTEAGEDIRAAIQRQDIENMQVLLSGLDPDKRDMVLEQLEKTMKAVDR